MSDDLVIDVRNVSKAFPLYAKHSDILKEMVFGGVRHDVFWALRDVSFSVRAGQRVGIIGPNGAGKSTLLQIISGNLQPTSGAVSVNGSISALLSLVPAWNVEQTGIENIRFNLLLRGCTSAQIRDLTDEIVDFAELGAFISQPVKTYSAGMSARLSFAIATAVSPDILIVDEVLGAGDGYFANKALRRMKQMCDRGRALLFVSHSIGAIRSMCDTAVWFEGGAIRLQGPVDYVASQYEQDMLRGDEETTRAGNMKRLKETLHLVSPEDITAAGVCRLRIREQAGPSLSKTYFVRALDIKITDDHGVVQDAASLPLEESGHSHHLAQIQSQGCQWGRVYTKEGVDTRMLGPRTGAQKGGHVLIRPDLARVGTNPTLRISFEYRSDDVAPDKLGVDCLELNSVSWCAMEMQYESLADGWVEACATGPLSIPDEAARRVAESVAADNFTPAIEILETRIVTDNGVVSSVGEGQSFKLEVAVQCNRPVPAASVNINILRSDGVYAFYQPSGLSHAHIKQHIGRATVQFDFTSNPFGAGDYEVNVFACNEWSWNNIPPSDIYDKSLGEFRFSVRLSAPIEFGIIRATVPVTVALGR